MEQEEDTWSCSGPAVLSVLLKPDPAALSPGHMENQHLPALPGDLGFSSIVCFTPGLFPWKSVTFEQIAKLLDTVGGCG